MRTPNDRITRVEVLLDSVMPRIEHYMKEGTEGRIKHAELMGEIAQNIASLKEYTERCDEDRLRHDGRIRVLEDDGNKQRGMMAAISAGVSFLVTVGIEWWGKK